MSTSGQRRRDRPRAAAGVGPLPRPASVPQRPAAEDPGGGPDPLRGLREALLTRDPAALAECFHADGWVRVPRPEGDLLFHGHAEIERAGRHLKGMFHELTWTPSQRFLAAGQIVEEAVALAATSLPAGGSPLSEGDIGNVLRVPARVVAAVDEHDPRLASLTLWVDWAALNDPLGVRSPRGAASALVARARARDERGLRVIRGEPGAAPLPPAPREPADRRPRPRPPHPAVLWWRRHRLTVAGVSMAAAAVVLMGQITVSTLESTTQNRLTGARMGPDPQDPHFAQPGLATPSVAAGREPARGAVPRINTVRPSATPTVQRGEKIDLLTDFLFRTGSAELTQGALAEINHMAGTVRSAGVRGTIQVNGYTDSRGSKASNADLSQRRALAVAQVLAPQLKGLPVDLTPQGFGETSPVAPNTTPDGRAHNRRVTVVLPGPAGRSAAP